MKYVAFLRGINVSGQKIIKMEKLKIIFEELKFKNVETYIQSGNVIFDASGKDSVLLTKKIEKRLHESLGYEISIMLRSLPGIETIISDNPFKKIMLDKNINLYVTFLSAEPVTALKKSLIASSDNVATFRVLNQEVYTLYNRTNAKHPFSNNFVEKKLKVSATTRNWSVINKILNVASK